MKAMVLAAGLGTRLRPLTNDRPKALIEINGRTLLEITLSRLRSFGVREAIINVYHFADMIVDYLKASNNFGMRIEISREYFAQGHAVNPLSSVRLTFVAWCRCIAKTALLRLSWCKTARPHDICCSTITFNFADAALEMIRPSWLGIVPIR